MGVVRVAAVSPTVSVGDIATNAAALAHAIDTAAADDVTLVVTPELGLTGYSAGDLFAQDLLVDRAWAALMDLAAHIGQHQGLVGVVGLPVRTVDARLYNCAAVVAGGVVVGLVPKQFLPNRAEFYEDRWFTRAYARTLPASHLGIPFGTDLVFRLAQPGAIVGVEICEDLWAVEPPSGRLALAGATIIANPSASPEVLGKATYRRELLRQQSARCLAAYVYAGSGPGESSTDLVFAGHCLIADNGSLAVESSRFDLDGAMVSADVDLDHLRHERTVNSSFASATAPPVRVVDVGAMAPVRALGQCRRVVDPRPFVPTDPTRRREHCEEIFAIQSTGLAKRLRHTGARRVTLGLSGGLDSTLALLVATRAFDLVGLERRDIITVTMPGFGTTERTYGNAVGLMASLGTTVREIAISDAVGAHFGDIGHDPGRHDVVYENAQARERTQILMDLANEVGGFVVGTGDLSEAALGWMTFNGDHMSMYHVNVGVPKTLVRYLVEWAADDVFSEPTRTILRDIVATPISPELLPHADGRLTQHTEDLVGPYDLHDFFLFHVVRHGSRPAKVMALAELAFADRYDPSTIVRWFEVFLRRFFSQQFKRSSMPDGPKVGSVALSPRGDWRMPSDASPNTWLEELARISPPTA